jgi:hypothetical protein
MYWLDIAKIAGPAAICAFVMGPRTAIAFLITMVMVVVFGFGLLAALGDGQTGLAAALGEVVKNGLHLFEQMMGAGAAGIVVGWWLRTWTAMARSSRMTRERRSPI